MVSVTINDTHGTPNLSLIINVVGQAISIDPATDVAGNLATTWSELLIALNADPAVTALVSMEGTGTVSNIAQPGECHPNPVCTLSDETGSGIIFTASASVGIYTSQLAFIGVRRNPGALPLLGACQNYKPSTYTYVLTGTLAAGQVKGYGVGQAPVSLFQTINDYDFELHQIIITYTPGPDVTLPAVCSALILYDAVKNQTANIPPLDKFWNGAPGSEYEDGGIVPPLVYPQQTQIRVDLFNLLQDADLPVTVNVHLVGKNRKPC